MKVEPHPPQGRLRWRSLLQWLRDDGLVSRDEADRVRKLLSTGDESQHPLGRLSSAKLSHARTGRTLDSEGLTEWLAGRLGIPFLHIDPLKVDVAHLTEVMSFRYAENRRALPVTVGANDVTVATCEPLDTGWVREVEAHTKKSVRLVLSDPVQVQRFTTEFYMLAHSVGAAVKNGASSALASFEQLVQMRKSSAHVDANDKGVVQVVDWLWQYAFDQRASDIHLEPRREMGVIRFRIDGVLHTVYQVPSAVMTAMIARIKLLGRMDVIEKRRPLDGRIKTVRPMVNGLPSGDMEMRLSTLPTAFGEKMVMRIFDPDRAVKSIGALGFGERDT